MRVDLVRRDDFVGVEVDDGDGVLVGDGEDAFAVVLDADAEVVHAAGAAQAHLAVGGDMVGVQPEVARGADRRG